MAQQYSWPSSSNVTLTGSTNGTPIPTTTVVVGGEDASGNVTPFQFEADGDLKVAITGSALPAGAATEAKQDDIIAELVDVNTELDSQTAELIAANASLDAIEASTASIDTAVLARLSGSLVPAAYDYIGLTYVTVGNGIGQVETAVYKLGGSGGTTVKTLTLSYDANDKLSAVEAS